MPNPYFGERWDVPATEGAEQAPTPIGQPCGWCTVPIQDGDRGFLLGHVAADGTAAAQPWHRECLLRCGVGSPAHLDGRCSCRGVAEDPLTPEQMRAEALEVWDRVQSGRLYRA